jgi:hypothetical protein
VPGVLPETGSFEKHSVHVPENLLYKHFATTVHFVRFRNIKLLSTTQYSGKERQEN